MIFQNGFERPPELIIEGPDCAGVATIMLNYKILIFGWTIPLIICFFSFGP